jgi:diaminopimelate decarboxylase
MNKNDFYKLVSKAELREGIKEQDLPAFYYFNKVIKKKHFDLAACLPDKIKIHYAFKANPNEDILKTMHSLGMGADVASGGELRAAQNAGFSPRDVEFTGPGKTLGELSSAIDLGVGCINVESISEIHKIAGLCRAKKTSANVGIRVNPRKRPSSSAMRMGGDTQFGIIENDLEEAISVFASEKELLHFSGLHMHLGSQYFEADKFVANCRFILEKSLEIAHRFNIRIKKINFGGGWGIDMYGKKPPLDLSSIKAGVSSVFADFADNAFFQDTRFIMEPGRFLVAECGVYAVEVLYRKKSYSREFLIVDGGMHQHFGAAGGIGQVIRRNYEVDTLADDRGDGTKTPFTIAGSLCIPDDILAHDLELDAGINEGDVLLFFNSGAYGFSASPLKFLSHPAAGEIYVS